MAENSFLTYTITIITIFIALFVPVPIAQEYRLVVIAALILFFIALTLSGYNQRLQQQESEFEKIKERLKIHEQLIDIKADIQMLKRGLRK
ncbi:hypothetical protein KW805_02000 [Candidatus Pacearchaeota archaeon]|nr:hypothetical protein [Candidatus Pacearchaeota archaeon]